MRLSSALLLAATLAAATAHAADIAALTRDTRDKALPLLPKVAGLMKQTVKEEGVAGAIPVCKDKAPTLARQFAGELGWRFGRVSLQPRNPQRGTPDVWEARQLADFNIRAANGEKPETLEAGEIVAAADGKRYFRYMRALPVGQVCLNCHGGEAEIDPQVRAELSRQYSHDRATGYGLGQIRGALTVWRPIED